MPKRVLVLGAGLMGLSCATALQEALGSEVQVTIAAEHVPPHTTGDVSVGLWTPYLMYDTPMDKIIAWSTVTWEYLYAFWKRREQADIGLNIVSGYLLDPTTALHDQPAPGWADLAFTFRKLNEQELKVMFPDMKSGWFYTVLGIDSHKFNVWLLKRFHELGGILEVKKISSQADIPTGFDLVVNCTGVGSKILFNDDDIIPICGQVHRVHAPWVKHFVIYPDAYIVPTVGWVGLGRAQDGASLDRQLDATVKKEIIERAHQILPGLQSEHVVSDHIGFSCGRKTLRLELETLKSGTKVVHNYGHGECGYTLFRGCALDVLTIARKELGL